MTADTTYVNSTTFTATTAAAPQGPPDTVAASQHATSLELRGCKTLWTTQTLLATSQGAS
jgi:hypothetical protein